METLKYRCQFIKWLTIKATNLSDYLLKERPWKYTFQECSKMDKDSLGYSLYTYLSENNLTFKPNLIRHDMKHILLNYEMKMEDELKLNAFLIGNKSNNLVGYIYLITCLFFIPEMITKLKIDYRKGKVATRLKSIDLQNLAEVNLTELRNTLNITI